MINIRTLEAFLDRTPIFVGAFIDGMRVDSITVLREDEIPDAIKALRSSIQNTKSRCTGA